MSESAAIVGAGIFGSSLAYRLARDGWDVTLYERHEPGHRGAASGGESRLIRFATARVTGTRARPGAPASSGGSWRPRPGGS